MEGRGGNWSQSGQSLVEVIIAILLLASIFLALAVALLTVTAGTHNNERVQSIDTGLVSYGAILRTQVPYENCSATLPADYTTAADAFIIENLAVNASTSTSTTTPQPLWQIPHGMEVRVLEVDSWNLATRSFTGAVDDTNQCSAPDSGAQRVRYEVELQGTVRAGEVVKRRCGPAHSNEVCGP